MKNHLYLLALVLTVAGCSEKAAPLSALDQTARQTCMSVIEARAVNRKSISYLGDVVAPVKDAKGQLTVLLKFSAKNEIGMASTMVAQCLVSADGKSMVDIVVKEGR